MSSFVHLHVHTQYSVLDGQASVQALVDKAIADGMPAIAITDHGNMFGVKEFTNYIKKTLKKWKEKGTEVSLKPIIGCEVYVARHGKENKRREVKEDARGWHLILLAKNYQGYKNLIKIVSRAWTDGLYYTPRTDHADLEKYHEGLICCSACLGGEIPQYILKGELDRAEESVRWFKNLFGDDFYLELQRHKPTVPEAAQDTYPKQVEVNARLVEFARKYDIKLVCTNDVHFVNEDDAEAHHRLLCVNTGNDVNDYTKMAYTKQEWFKTTAEMSELFADIPEALDNTLEIAGKVEEYSIDHKAIMPDYQIPPEFEDQDAYLRHLTYEGAKRLYPEINDELRERIDFELNTIKNMGFPGYFLIVQDFIAGARSLGVSVGPGRGSAAGSVVAYCLGITKVDPIKYDLLFERFLNPDRISLPDIDTDFDDDGRGEVLRWVENKYGKEKVSHIITYGTMATKSAIKDVARVEKLPLSEADRLAKLIPDRLIVKDKDGKDKTEKINFKNCLANIPELRAELESGAPLVQETLKYAIQLEGNVRNIGVHACGVIIGRDDISDWVPVCTADDKETGEKLLVTQYEGSVIEETGMIKMDFLGLKTLSILKEAQHNIKMTHGVEIDLDNIPLDDPKTYELYCAGKTIGTFQFESPGMQKYLRELQPSQFGDLIAMNALYRPGPMDYIPDFIDRKHGRKPIEYDIPCMEKYLKETYGITVYQEQVMLLSRQLAGFTRGQSDTLRKAMGKKQIEKMKELEGLFYEGGEANGHSREILQKIWNDWKKFAEYAFNKSHATCYSVVAFQTAYLKAHYPSEYMAAVMTRNINNISEVSRFMAECKSMGIKVLGPDVNESGHHFTVNKQGNIRFGLGAIKGMGESAAKAIIEEREANGPYDSVFDLVERVSPTLCGRKNLEILASAGAFDSFEGMTREQYRMLTDRGEPFLDVLMRYGQKYQEDKQNMFGSIFGDDMSVTITRPTPPPTPLDFSIIERLNLEKDCIGMFLSAHPLDQYYVYLKYVCTLTTDKIRPMLDSRSFQAGREYIFAGMVTDVRTRMTKKGDEMADVTIEDYEGSYTHTFFPKSYVKFRNFLYKGAFLSIRGHFATRMYAPDKADLEITQIALLSEVMDTAIEKLHVMLPLNSISEDFVNDFVARIDDNQGKTLLYLSVYDDTVSPRLNTRLHSVKRRVRLSKELMEELNEMNGLTLMVN
ncbi:MAG: DNA polymerase III subunit alpha [Bacteroidales bacterium]|nr:DNA polymerase III subunit alpha [Bacteroidales bacterium]